jgi:hypothetical protein
MKTTILLRQPVLLITLAAGLLVSAHSTLADAPPAASLNPASSPPTPEAAAAGEASPVKPARRELPWLGLSADEPPEVLVAQLGLEPGVGLVVEFVSEGSPAAAAGLRQHDLLVAFDDQPLVHPAQLRKLVQARKEGDLVKLTYYRAGKKETCTAKLGLTAPGLGLPGGELAWRGDLRELQRQLRDIPVGEEFQRRMESLRDTFGQYFGPEQRRAMTDQMREAAESARRAAREAMRSMTNAGLRELRQALEEIERDGMAVARDARVTVHRNGSQARTMVQADDSGTYVLIGNPTPRLTVHGSDGTLLFDGPVATPEEREKIPRELRAKLEPMLDKFLAEPAAPSQPAKPGKAARPETF